MEILSQWLAGIFSALFAELVKEALRNGGGALQKALDGARGEEAKALRIALPRAIDALKLDSPEGHQFVEFLEQKQKVNDRAFGDALLRALFVEPQGVLSLTANLQAQIPLDLQLPALKFLSLFHQQLWRQPPFDKLLQAKAAQDELRVALESLQVLQRIEKALDRDDAAVSIRDNAQVKVERDLIGQKNVYGDEINTGGDANIANIGAGASVRDIIFDGKRTPTPEELAAANRAYLEFVTGANKDVKPPSVVDELNLVSLQLDEIYVPVTITSEKLKEDKNKQDKSREEPPKRIELAQLVKDYSRVVLLGEPGAGKTTILRYLALHFAKTLLDSDGENVRAKENDLGAARLPIFVRLADFAGDNRSLREYLPNAFGNNGVLPEALKLVFENALQQGKALILLDGLDEVLDNRAELRNARAYVIDQIESFDAGLQKGNQIIVTSRRSSYGRALGGAFKAFALNDLERDQIDNFLRYWNLAIERKSSQGKGERFQSQEEFELAARERAHEKFVGIEQKLDTNVGAQNLAKNPLTLRMLAEAYRFRDDLPSRRVDLYNLIVKQSLEFWEVQVAGVEEGRNVRYDEAIHLLSPLAYWMHSEKESPSEREVKQQLTKALKENPDRISPTKSIAEAVDDFWTRVRERTGLFVQDTPNQYRFVHATFREYFAGLNLIQDREEAAKRISAHRHQPRWEEPILLGIAYVSTDEPDFASDLIRTAILAEGEQATRLGFKQSRYEDVLHRDLLFATKCIGGCVGLDEDLLENIFRELSAIYSTNEEFPINDQIDAALRTLRGSDAARVASRFSLKVELEDEVAFHEALGGTFWRLKEWGIGQHTIESILLQALKNENPEIRSQAVVRLGQLGNLAPHTIDVLGESLHDKNNHVRLCAVLALTDIGEVPPAIAAEITRIAFESSGETSYEAREKLKKLKGEHPEVTSILVTALKSGDPTLQDNAISTAEKFGHADPELIAALLLILENRGGVDLRRKVVRALGRLSIATSEVISTLIKEFQSEEYNDSGRLDIAKSVIGLGRADSEIVDFLSDLIQKIPPRPWSWMRENAIELLGEMRGDNPRATVALLTALKDEDAEVRLDAVRGLGNLREASPEAVSALLELARDENNQPSVETVLMPSELLNEDYPSNPEAVPLPPELPVWLSDENDPVVPDAAPTTPELPSAKDDRTRSNTVLSLPEFLAPPELSSAKDDRLQREVAISLGRLASKKPEVLISLTESKSVNEDFLYQLWYAFEWENTPLVVSALVA